MSENLTFESLTSAVPYNSRGRYTKKDYSKKLFDLLYEEPLSRRMAATKLGFIDQTYMVTQCIYDWINEDKAQVIGVIQCSRSNRMVQAVTTNPKLFISTNEGQLKFDF